MKVVVLVLVLCSTVFTASLVAKPSVVQHSGDNVTIVWDQIPNPSKLDYIAVYSPETSSKEHYLWLHSVESSGTWKHGKGSITFPLINMRAAYRFAYVRQASDSISSVKYLNVTLIERSNVIRFANPNEPLQPHLALTNDPSQLVLMWITNSSSPGVVMWGSNSNSYQYTAPSMSHSYGIEMMCGAPATDPKNWRNPGAIHTATIHSLAPNTIYYYVYGNEDEGMSFESWFRSPVISQQSDEMVRVGAYGDMGVYGSMPHSNPCSTHTAAHLAKKVLEKEIDLIFHIGDISYARGYSYIWDTFFAEIAPLASHVPYMVSIGNHEYDWPGQPFKPKWADYSKDSGGECGVPFNARFSMPGDSSHKNLWYSAEYGPIHFTVMSAEHDFLVGSEQWKWLVNDLATVDRTKTPWVVFSGHRPMYSSAHSSNEMMDHLKDAMEPLFKKHKVDLALWGHVHVYERTCAMYNSKCVDDGTTHVVIGMAGAPSQGNWKPKPQWSIYRSHLFGYTTMTANSTALHFEYFGDQHDTVLDEFWLYH